MAEDRVTVSKGFKHELMLLMGFWCCLSVVVSFKTFLNVLGLSYQTKHITHFISGRNQSKFELNQLPVERP